MSADTSVRRDRFLDDLAALASNQDAIDYDRNGAVPDVVADLVAACDDPSTAHDAAFALGWFHPGSYPLERLAAPVDHRRMVLSALLLGLAQRCGEVTAASLADDPRLQEPVHQMLGARLADETALRSALDVTHKHLVNVNAYVDASGSGPAAVLALGLELAASACETAMLATMSAPTRARLEGRRKWLSDLVDEGNPLRLLDQVAAGLDEPRSS